ncbi:putative amidoligase enzyme-domain-containing protein [Daldinia caldariorum]|uniref:putative amidoligase enzyme-domain-containing protein n=1 Tax=Daldinia caldariorum TaxID=326644 RepID=UPI002007CDF8|nr:putative amidoligase enzyme-domain-containing protein [Daldinia caldariorum]KAI1469959.1 putative amidoligase enzyme-domain-containing protein [Daldinia caldariorum]
MEELNEFTVPVGTRQSFGIELEFLVAYLPHDVPDPNEVEAHALPPLLRINETNYEATTKIKESIRATLRKNGIRVSEPDYDLAAAEPASTDKLPSRLHDKDKWSVTVDSSVQEKFMEKYKWQPIEIQSPALWTTDESFQEIEYVTNILTYNYRLRVNPTCGFHVHVGNGKDFFTGETIRRLGMFLWVADPMLSRLHPPWRRVHSYSSSIRYHSRLACEGISVKDVRKEFESWYANDDPIAVTKFSDTSREEIAFGSREKWEAYAKWRNQVGPFMTIKNDVDREPPEHYPPTEYSSGSEPPYLPSWDEIVALGRRLREQHGQFDAPPEDHTLHRNISWIYWDAFQGDAVIEHVLSLAEEHFGTRNVTELATADQIQLVILAECEILYSRSLDEVSDSMFYVVLLASASYFEAARYGFQYNSATGQFDLASSKFGPILWKPRPNKEERIDSPSIIKKWQHAAELMEPDDDPDDDPDRNSRDRLSLSEYIKAIQTNEGISDLFDKAKASAGPASSVDENELPSPLFFGTPSPPPASAPEADSGAPDANSSSPDPKSSPLDPNPEPLPRAQDQDQDPSTEEESDPSFFNPLTRYLAKEHDYSFSDPSSPFSPFPPYEEPEPEVLLDEEDEENDGQPWPFDADAEIIEKLRPHDVDGITALYQSEIDKYVHIADAQWDRIGWIPSISHAAIYGKAFRDVPAGQAGGLQVHPRTSGAEGLAKLAGCDSAMAAATLLQGPFGRRLNYNFRWYGAEQLKDDREDGPRRSANARTLEFREAGGTLEARWVGVWARIATGIVRFARRAPPLEFLLVLERILDQEERDLAIREKKKNAAEAKAKTRTTNGTYDLKENYEEEGEEEKEEEEEEKEEEEEEEEYRYDICDLLNDLGLFAESSYVWKREQQYGPPR